MYQMIPIDRTVTVNTLVLAVDAVRPRGFYFSGEVHDFWEMVFVRSGNAVAAAEDKIYRLSAGQLLFHKPMEFHRIWTDGDAAPHLMILSFQAAGAGMDFFKEKCLSVPPEMFAAYEKTVQLFQKAVRAHREEDVRYSILSERAAASLTAFLLELTEAKEREAELLSEEESRYQRIMHVMNAHCCENLSVEDIAALCQMSVSTLKRSFSLFSDKGVATVFRTLKMRRAMQLLSDGSSAVHAAAAVGFSDPAYFHTVFKREFGITPLQYKRRKR